MPTYNLGRIYQTVSRTQQQTLSTMVKIKAKKQKLVKLSETNNTATNKIVKKLKKKTTKNKPAEKKTLPLVAVSVDNTSDDDSPSAASSSSSDDDVDPSEPDSEQIKTLLEPYTKDQLIDLIADAAVNHRFLYTRILDAADRDAAHRKIFVHGLGWDTTGETLTAAFEPFGEIEDCNVVTDRVTGKAKGFGFVLFKSRQGALKALKEPRKKINNRMASCQLASLGPVASSSDSSTRKIYVSNVQADVDPERLRSFFAKFGEIEMGPMGFDTATGKSRGFALFLFKTAEGACKALEEPYKMFEGQQLHCEKAADGKNKGTLVNTSAAVGQTAPVLSAVAAAQNLALLGQHPALNSMYGGFFANPNAGFLAPGQVNSLLAGQGVLGSSQTGPGNLGTGFGGYGGAQAQGLGNLGGNQSLLGMYGTSSGPMLQGLGLQHAYPNSQIGQNSAVRPQGSGGSFGGYSTRL